MDMQNSTAWSFNWINERNEILSTVELICSNSLKFKYFNLQSHLPIDIC